MRANDPGWPTGDDEPSWLTGRDDHPDWPAGGGDHPSWPAGSQDPGLGGGAGGGDYPNGPLVAKTPAGRLAGATTPVPAGSQDPGWPAGGDYPSWPEGGVDPGWPPAPESGLDGGGDHPSWPAGGGGEPGWAAAAATARTGRLAGATTPAGPPVAKTPAGPPADYLSWPDGGGAVLPEREPVAAMHHDDRVASGPPSAPMPRVRVPAGGHPTEHNSGQHRRPWQRHRRRDHITKAARPRAGRRTPEPSGDVMQLTGDSPAELLDPVR